MGAISARVSNQRSAEAEAEALAQPSLSCSGKPIICESSFKWTRTFQFVGLLNVGKGHPGALDGAYPLLLKKRKKKDIAAIRKDPIAPPLSQQCC